MITFIYDGCFYCGKPVPVDWDYTEYDTIFCSQICMVQWVVYDMLVQAREEVAEEVEEVEDKHFGFKLTPVEEVQDEEE